MSNIRFADRTPLLNIIKISLFLLTASLLVFNPTVGRAQGGGGTITTVAGGGFGSSVPSRKAPMVQPTAVVFDPLGRGFYVVDDTSGTSLLRFVNTTGGPVTLAGATIGPGEINLIAGGGIQITDGSLPRDVDLAQVTGIVVDPSGKLVYLATPAFIAVRVVNVSNEDLAVNNKMIKAGTIGTLFSPSFFDFRGLALHPATGEMHFIAGRVVYKADSGGNVTPVAGGGTPANGNGDGGTATLAQLTLPMGLAFDKNNNLLIAEGGDVRSISGAVRKVDSGGIISSLASGLEFPTGITVSPAGDAYVPLGNAQQVIRVTPAGQITRVAGNTSFAVCDLINNPTCGDGGPALQASLSIPDSTANTSLLPAVNNDGLYLPDFRYKRVRFVNLSGTAKTILGQSIANLAINSIVGNGKASPYDGDLATYSELFAPTGVTVDGQGNFYIADTGNNRLRFVNRTAAPLTLFNTTPFATTVQPGQIVTLNSNTGDVMVDERITTTFFLSPQGLVATPNGVLIVDSQAGALIKVPPTSLIGRRSGVIRFLNTSSSPVTFFPDNPSARVEIPPGHIKDIAGVRPPANPQGVGDGLAANQVAFFPSDIALDSLGNIYLADQGNNRVRRIDASNGIVGTVYGNGTTATLNSPTGIAFDNTGRLLIADTRNNRILRQNTAGGAFFSVIADASKNINRPRDLTVNSSGKIFITNVLTHQILSLEAPNNSLGTTAVVAGTGTSGFSGDGGPASAARLNLPNPGTATNDIQVTTNIITLPNGDLVFADTNNNRIRMIQSPSSSNPVASVSAASFAGQELAGESIVAAFGQSLATGTLVANNTPLPTQLNGTTVKITDSAGTERPAPLFFVASSQINLQIPPGTVSGPATIKVNSGDGTVSTGNLNISNVAPGLFTANASGQGVAAAVVLRVKADNSQTFEPIAQYDPNQNKFVPIPIDLGPDTDQLFLIAFGTGFRYRSSLMASSVTIGGTNSELLYAGQAEGFVGLDQANIRIPRSLASRGLVDVVMTVDGKQANVINIEIK